MREDFTLADGQEGYAVFDKTGECVQFVLFWYDARSCWSSYRYPVAYGGLDYQDYVSVQRDIYLLTRFLSAANDVGNETGVT